MPVSPLDKSFSFLRTTLDTSVRLFANILERGWENRNTRYCPSLTGSLKNPDLAAALAAAFGGLVGIVISVITNWVGPPARSGVTLTKRGALHSRICVLRSMNV